MSFCVIQMLFLIKTISFSISFTQPYSNLFFNQRKRLHKGRHFLFPHYDSWKSPLFLLENVYLGWLFAWLVIVILYNCMWLRSLSHFRHADIFAGIGDGQNSTDDIQSMFARSLLSSGNAELIKQASKHVTSYDINRPNAQVSRIPSMHGWEWNSQLRWICTNIVHTHKTARPSGAWNIILRMLTSDIVTALSTDD